MGYLVCLLELNPSFSLFTHLHNINISVGFVLFGIQEINITELQTDVTVEQHFKLEGVASGSVHLQLRRIPLTSPELSDTLQV